MQIDLGLCTFTFIFVYFKLRWFYTLDYKIVHYLNQIVANEVV